MLSDIHKDIQKPKLKLCPVTAFIDAHFGATINPDRLGQTLRPGAPFGEPKGPAGKMLSDQSLFLARLNVMADGSVHQSKEEIHPELAKEVGKNWEKLKAQAAPQTVEILEGGIGNLLNNSAQTMLDVHQKVFIQSDRAVQIVSLLTDPIGSLEQLAESNATSHGPEVADKESLYFASNEYVVTLEIKQSVKPDAKGDEPQKVISYGMRVLTHDIWAHQLKKMELQVNGQLQQHLATVPSLNLSRLRQESPSKTSAPRGPRFPRGIKSKI